MQETPILVVDDDPDVRQLLAAVLRNAGYRVDVAADGVVAVEKAQKLNYAVILLDISMPRMGGYEVLRCVNGFDSRVRFIIITADRDADRRLETVRERITAYLPKPFLIPVLLRSVAAACRDYASRFSARPVRPTHPREVLRLNAPRGNGRARGEEGQAASVPRGVDAMPNSPPAAGPLLLGAVCRARNPLTGIQAAAEILNAQLAPDDSRRRYADRIIRDSQRLEHLLHSFAMVLKPPVEPARLHRLAPLLESAVRAVERDVCRAPAQVNLDLPADLPPIPLHPEQICWAVAELVRNALAAADEEREGLVEVSVRCLPGEGNLVIEVVDNGRGIDAAQLRRLAREPVEGESCLGLRIVNWVVAGHGGTLRLRGRSGIGSMATIELPMSAPAPESAPGV